MVVTTVAIKTEHINPPPPFLRIRREDTLPTVLTVAGSDPSGGAGIEADLKTLTAHHVYAMTCITALTVQTPRSVMAVQEIPHKIVSATLANLLRDMRIDVIKTGMLTPAATTALLELIDKGGFEGKVVVDPVMVSTSGDRLVDCNGKDNKELFKKAAILTPNLDEAFLILGRHPVEIKTIDDMTNLAIDLVNVTGAQSVLLKGGHVPWQRLAGGVTMADILVTADGEVTVFKSKLANTTHTHGTGCSLASAIAANLSHGFSLSDAVHGGIEYVHSCIELNPVNTVTSLSNNGPINHVYDIDIPLARMLPEAYSSKREGKMAGRAANPLPCSNMLTSLDDIITHPLVEPHWHNYVEHSFVEQVAQGTLPLDMFRSFLEQDTIYLHTFARIHALAASKSPSEIDFRDELAVIQSIIDEIEKHAAKIKQYFPERKHDSPITPCPATNAYTSYLLDVARRGSWEQICVSLMPCLFGYNVAASRFDSPDKILVPPDHCYYKWIKEYTAESFTDSVKKGAVLLQRIISNYSDHDVLLRIFADVCVLEAHFWDTYT